MPQKHIYKVALQSSQLKRNKMVAKLKLTDERNYFKPFSYPWAYEAWLKHEQSHWLHTEVPMADDVKDLSLIHI